MKFLRGQLFGSLKNLFVSPGLGPAQQAERIHALERNIITPVKGLVIITLIYFFYFSNWIAQVSRMREVAFETIRTLFLGYVVAHIVAAAIFIGVRRLPLLALEWMVFTLGLLDGILLGALTLITGGFDSILYWLFLSLILHHAVAIRLATPQIVLNIITCLFYLVAGLIDVPISQREALESAWDIGTRRVLDLGNAENPAEPLLLRLILLFLWALCCYGVQALLERQKVALEEAQEFAERQQQLQTAGRLAAEIAHRIKNPLGIITNAAYSLHRAVQEGKKSAQDQIQIIREEVDRADRIITELMGYAQLAEGKVERLDVIEELDRAIDQVFPPGAKYQTRVIKVYGRALPSLLMQRGHLSEIFVNLLTNAREAMGGKGKIEVNAHYGENYSVVVEILDEGPGIAPEKIEKIFEAYFTTKPKGTGLGLAIVKHNVEIYGGQVLVQSELGKGTKFILTFPAKAVMRLSK